MDLDYLSEKLDERVKSGNIRQLSSNVAGVDFVSNDYLGLAQNRELADLIGKRIGQEQVPNGGTGSRLLSGNYSQYTETEGMLAKLFDSEATLIFNSGYAANQALVSAVAERGDTIIYDQLSHVCLKEGAWLSKAATTSFEHNDLESLERKLTLATGKKFVLTESIFSMDGDVAPLREIVDLCEKHQAYLIVDEAHSTGVLGPAGSGMLVEQGLHHRVFARVYTFGKGMGVHGACVAGPQLLIDYLINFGRPFIYTTSLPPHSIISIQESFKYLAANPHLQENLQAKIALFRSLWHKSLSHTAVQPVMIGSSDGARRISAQLQHQGFDVRPILSPTVKKGTERLRISLHVHNSDEEIYALINALSSLMEDV